LYYLTCSEDLDPKEKEEEEDLEIKRLDDRIDHVYSRLEELRKPDLALEARLKKIESWHTASLQFGDQLTRRVRELEAKPRTTERTKERLDIIEKQLGRINVPTDTWIREHAQKVRVLEENLGLLPGTKSQVLLLKDFKDFFEHHSESGSPNFVGTFWMRTCLFKAMENRYES
jgi:hypothetical protein